MYIKIILLYNKTMDKLDKPMDKLDKPMYGLPFHLYMQVCNPPDTYLNGGAYVNSCINSTADEPPIIRTYINDDTEIVDIHHHKCYPTDEILIYNKKTQKMQKKDKDWSGWSDPNLDSYYRILDYDGKKFFNIKTSGDQNELTIGDNNTQYRDHDKLHSGIISNNFQYFVDEHLKRRYHGRISAIFFNLRSVISNW
jgi:hypothetical protein